MRTCLLIASQTIWQIDNNSEANFDSIKVQLRKRMQLRARKFLGTHDGVRGNDQKLDDMVAEQKFPGECSSILCFSQDSYLVLVLCMCEGGGHVRYS
jgi:hypothetical protein